jgi:glycyl-radical enzyme activating protein
MSKNGIIFDIQRFSLHDGPGIRTTVFLKGCSLRCKWCHNPESWNTKPQLQYRKEKCTNCLACVAKCPFGAHIVLNELHSFIPTQCRNCFHCVRECAYGALKTAGSVVSAAEVMKEVEADMAFYKNSGGGVTISGGEPMLQPEFVLELLKLAKEKGIHTCIETSGYTNKENFFKILTLTDLFLFDIKATSPEPHKELTGVTNEIILENLDILYNSGASILLRCPLIPGINDTEAHLQGIATLAKKYPRLMGIEVMPYHDLGRGKWEEIGLMYELGDLKSADQEIRNQWALRLKEMDVDIF